MTDDRREWYIYVLRDPRDNAVRYVGFTTDVGKRFYSHIYNANAGIKSHIYNWIRSLLLLDLQPVMEVIERGAGEWQSVEIYWIRHYRMQGARLTNATDGGEGVLGLKQSPESIEKGASKKRGRKHSPEHKERISQSLTGRKMPPEYVKKLRERKHAPETIERIRQANIGRKASPETRRKMSQRRKGRKLSPEHIEKVRQANIGNTHSPEAIERMRIVQTRIKGITVRRVEDGVIFPSLADAARAVNRVHTNILRAIKTGIRSAGYHWEYADKTTIVTRKKRGMSVIRVEDGVVFPTQTQAGHAVNRGSSKICAAIKHGTKCAGYHWERVGETPPADPYTLDGNALMMRFD